MAFYAKRGHRREEAPTPQRACLCEYFAIHNKIANSSTTDDLSILSRRMHKHKGVHRRFGIDYGFRSSGRALI
jgi:hypothetical protein